MNIITLLNDPDLNLHYMDSQKYINDEQLIKLEIMKSSIDYDQYVNTKNKID
jgi:hypothetical protein